MDEKKLREEVRKETIIEMISLVLKCAPGDLEEAIANEMRELLED